MTYSILKLYIFTMIMTFYKTSNALQCTSITVSYHFSLIYRDLIWAIEVNSYEVKDWAKVRNLQEQNQNGECALIWCRLSKNGYCWQWPYFHISIFHTDVFLGFACLAQKDNWFDSTHSLTNCLLVRTRSVFANHQRIAQMPPKCLIIHAMPSCVKWHSMSANLANFLTNSF